MSDFSFLEILQQSQARSVSGEELEIFGKHAAQRFAEGGVSMNQAIVEEVKHAGLAPEQVRRVIEFANTAAFLHGFAKEGSHKVVEFEGGPADPSIVLQDLNDGGGGTVFDRGLGDYVFPPTEKAAQEKLAEATLQEMFAVDRTAPGIPEENPLGDVIDFRDKVAGLSDHLTAELGGTETLYLDLVDRLFDQVKAASLGGYSLGDVVTLWSTVTDEPLFMKAAFAAVSDKLVEGGVFKDTVEICESMTKVAATQRLVNDAHPLIQDFGEYCQVLVKLAELRGARDEALEALDTATRFLLDPRDTQAEFFAKFGADGGAVGKLVAGAESAGKFVGPKAQALGELLVGKGQAAKTIGSLTGKAVKYAPHAAGAALTMRGMQHLQAMGQTPIGHEVKSLIPGTQDHAQKQYELNAAYGGGYPGY